MRPYYQDKWVTIYHGDCLSILPELNVKVDMVLTDPPYNVGKQYGASVNDKMSKQDYRHFSEEWFELARKISPLIIFTPGMVNFQDWIMYKRANNILSWYRRNSRTMWTYTVFMVWEPILVYGTSKKRPLFDAYDVPIQTAGESFGHPCPKPQLLWSLLISDYSDPGDTILDPFLGIGTTCVAAKKLNRYSIGIEIEERYCESAAQRCYQESMEFNL